MPGKFQRPLQNGDLLLLFRQLLLVLAQSRLFLLSLFSRLDQVNAFRLGRFSGFRLFLFIPDHIEGLRFAEVNVSYYFRDDLFRFDLAPVFV